MKNRNGLSATVAIVALAIALIVALIGCLTVLVAGFPTEVNNNPHTNPYNIELPLGVIIKLPSGVWLGIPVGIFFGFLSGVPFEPPTVIGVFSHRRRKKIRITFEKRGRTNREEKKKEKKKKAFQYFKESARFT